MMHAHHWLILHGRYTCLARRPLCEKCVIADLCKWPGKTVLMSAQPEPRPHPLPRRGMRATARRVGMLGELYPTRPARLSPRSASPQTGG